MPTAELIDGEVHLDVNYAENEAVKLVPGAKWDRTARVWKLPLAWGPLVSLQGVFSGRVQAGPRLTEWTRTYYSSVVTPAYALRGAQDVEGDPELWPLQRVGVEFLQLVGHAILGDDMGTGKTRQAARALKDLWDDWEDAEFHGYGDLQQKPYPALFVVPTSVIKDWRVELELQGHRVAVAQGNVAKRRKAIEAIASGEADALVIGWDNLYAHSRCAPYGGLKMKRCAECGAKPDEVVSVRSCETHEKELNAIDWATVVADEAHRASNPRAKSTRALWWLGRAAYYRWALTGTPIKDHLDKAFGLLHFVSPEDWPSYVKLRDRYCLTAYNPWSGGQDVVGIKPETAQELYSILDHRFLRRTKAEAMPWLPPKLYSKRYVTLPPKLRKAYDAMKEDLLAEIEDTQLIAWNPLEQSQRLTQLTGGMPVVEEWTDTDGMLRTRVTALKDPSPKLDALMEILEEMGSRPLVAYAPSLKLIRLAKKRLEDAKIPFGSVDGDTSQAERELHKEAFQEGRLRVMLLTDAGAEGLTLTRADTIVILQRPWSLIKSQQVEDRVYRGGAEIHPHVSVIDVIAEDTDDERMLDVLTGKEEGAEEILRDRQRLAAFLRQEK